LGKTFKPPPGLLWDVFAILTYLTTSAIFWYIGMLPDFATVRDRSTGIKRKIFNAMTPGWLGKMSSWRKFEDAIGYFRRD